MGEREEGRGVVKYDAQTSLACLVAERRYTLSNMIILCNMSHSHVQLLASLRFRYPQASAILSALVLSPVRPLTVRCPNQNRVQGLQLVFAECQLVGLPCVLPFLVSLTESHNSRPQT